MKIGRENKVKMVFRKHIEKYAVKLAEDSVKKSCPGYIYEPKVPNALLFPKEEQ